MKANAPSYGLGLKAWKYFIHFIKASNAHSIHSPLVFDLFEHLKKNPLSAKELTVIRSLHKELKSNSTLLSYLDPGKEMAPTQRTVAQLATRSGKGRREGKLLYNLASFFNYQNGLELGTSLGLSTAYQCLANPTASFTTVEGAPEIAALAEKHIQKNGIKALVVKGLFDRVLSDLISGPTKFDWVYLDGHHQYEATLSYYEQIKSLLRPQAWVVLDDIHWSVGMEAAWAKIQTDPAAIMTLDLFHFGVVIFGENAEKQHFKLRV